MIDVYFWTTPNGYKIPIYLEEADLSYRLIAVDIRKGDQFEEEFLRISPNNKIPAMVDHEPADGGSPFALFESGAILLYLGEKTGCYLPEEPRRRYTVLQWLMWQKASLGPMLGQNHHFSQYAPERINYAIERYRKETERLYGILDDQLAEHEFIAGDYSIVDMAVYPWIVPHDKQGQDLVKTPHLLRWFEQMSARPAVIRAYRAGRELNSDATVDQQSKRVLFGQGRRTSSNG